MIKKQAENFEITKILEKEHVWNVKTKVIAVRIEATGTISKSFRKYLSKISGKHDIEEIHKTATVGTPNNRIFFSLWRNSLTRALVSRLHTDTHNR